MDECLWQENVLKANGGYTGDGSFKRDQITTSGFGLCIDRCIDGFSWKDELFIQISGL